MCVGSQLLWLQVLLAMAAMVYHHDEMRREARDGAACLRVVSDLDVYLTTCSWAALAKGQDRVCHPRWLASRYCREWWHFAWLRKDNMHPISWKGVLGRSCGARLSCSLYGCLSTPSPRERCSWLRARLAHPNPRPETTTTRVQPQQRKHEQYFLKPAAQKQTGGHLGPGRAEAASQKRTRPAFTSANVSGRRRKYRGRTHHMQQLKEYRSKKQRGHMHVGRSWD